MIPNAPRKQSGFFVPLATRRSGRAQRVPERGVGRSDASGIRVRVCKTRQSRHASLALALACPVKFAQTSGLQSITPARGELTNGNWTCGLLERDFSKWQVLWVPNHATPKSYVVPLVVESSAASSHAPQPKMVINQCPLKVTSNLRPHDLHSWQHLLGDCLAPCRLRCKRVSWLNLGEGSAHLNAVEEPFRAGFCRGLLVETKAGRTLRLSRSPMLAPVLHCRKFLLMLLPVVER